MQKTKIEWVKNHDGTQGYSWNPIKGLCPAGCWYCYAKAMYRRFKWGDFLRLDYKEFNRKMPLKQAAGIFVCSTMELFHPEVKKEWRDHIFDRMQHYPWHRFYVLTKFPHQIDRPMPPNVWLGVTITSDGDLWRRNRLVTTNAKVKFISFEPLFGEIVDVKYALLQKIDWVIIGRLTGHGTAHDPRHRQLQHMVNDIRTNQFGYSPPVFLKNNLKAVWGGPLIQEVPK